MTGTFLDPMVGGALALLGTYWVFEVASKWAIAALFMPVDDGPDRD